MGTNGITRRESLSLAAAAAATATMPVSAAAAKTGGAARPLVTKIDFKDPKWNRDTYARMDGDVRVGGPGKLGWLKGTAYGVRENEPVRALMGIEGFSFIRCVAQPNGDWLRLCREVVFYRDLETGKILDTFHNPYTNEDVKVVPIANDPFNYTIGEYYPDPPSYGGLQTAKPPRRPYLLDWSEGPNDTLILRTGIDMMYPAALQPDKWPRESSGQFSRVSEHFIYTVKRKDVENPALTAIPHIGAWSRITPWMPWMLMGQAPGHVSYFTNFTELHSIDQLPKDIVERTRAMGDKWFSAPETNVGPSLSSLEVYARTQQPAPVPAGWTPPMPPPPRKLPPMPPKAG